MGAWDVIYSKRMEMRAAAAAVAVAKKENKAHIEISDILFYHRRRKIQGCHDIVEREPSTTTVKGYFSTNPPFLQVANGK